MAGKAMAGKARPFLGYSGFEVMIEIGKKRTL
jgi:hypothetical protein